MITREEQNPYAYQVMVYMDIGECTFGSGHDFYRTLCKKYNEECDDTSVWFNVLGQFIHDCETRYEKEVVEALEEVESCPYMFTQNCILKLKGE